ncbi:MAG: hypothetical protein CMH52_10595 [Myxococcales bacterium]|nr:hypothetical protein [Myxococcales bacterium]
MEMQPPFGNEKLAIGRTNEALAQKKKQKAEIWIPSSITQTELNLGIGKIGAKLGAKLTGKGKVLLDYRAKVGKDWVKGSAKTLEFTKFKFEKEKFTLNKLTLGQDRKTRSFGYRIGNPRYNIKLYLTPGINIFANVKVDYLFDSFKRSWDYEFWLDSFKITLVDGTLPTHANTTTDVDLTKIGTQSSEKWSGNKLLWVCLEEVQKNGKSYKPKRFLGISKKSRRIEAGDKCGTRQYVQIEGENRKKPLSFGDNVLLASPVSTSIIFCADKKNNTLCGNTSMTYKKIPFSLKNMDHTGRRVKYGLLFGYQPVFVSMAHKNIKRAGTKNTLGLSGDYGLTTFKFYDAKNKTAKRAIKHGDIVKIKISNGLWLSSKEHLYKGKHHTSLLPRFKVHVKPRTPPALSYKCPKGWALKTTPKPPYGPQDTLGPVCVKGSKMRQIAEIK